MNDTKIGDNHARVKVRTAFAQFAQALQWDRGRWIWLLCDRAGARSGVGSWRQCCAVLRYDRSAIAAGGWWRLLTAHIVHLDLHHLMLNELGLVLVWALFAQDYDPVEWCVIVLSGALAISSGLWWLSPRVSWYVGALGSIALDHGRGLRATSRRARLGSLDSDRCASPQSSLMSSSAGHEPALVVVDAHLYGAACGFVVGAALSWRVAIIRQRSRAAGPSRG